MPYPLDHIGYAVHDLDAAIADYQKKLGLTLDLREKLPEHGVEVAFLKLPNTKIELLAPLGAQSKLTKFLESHGPGIHHVCYKVENIRSELARLEGLGAKLLDRTPRPGAHNTEIAFIHPSSFNGVLTELCQYRD